MTAYIGPIDGELEDGRTPKVEIRLDNGEDGVKHQLSVVDHEEGDEFMLLHLDDEKLTALRDAIDERLGATSRT